MEKKRIIGKKLKELRKQKGFTQKQLAQIIGVEHYSISKYENGLFEPSADVLDKLSKFFSVPISYFFGDNLEESNVDKFIDRLVEEGIITDTEIDIDTQNMIINQVKNYLIFKKKKHEV